MINAYLAILRAEWTFLVSYGWLMIPLAVVALAIAIYLRHQDLD